MSEATRELWKIKGRRDGLIIIGDLTGLPRAIAYTEVDAPLVAAAPELFEIVDRIAELKQRDDGMLYGDEDYGYILEKARQLVAAIKPEGR